MADFDFILNDNVRALLQRENALQKEINGKRDEARVLQKARDALLIQQNKANVTADKETDKVNNEIDKLQAKRDKLYRKIDALLVAENGTRLLWDQISLIDYELRTFNAKARSVRDNLTKVEKSLAEKERRSAVFKKELKYRNAVEAEEAIKAIDAKVDEAKKSGKAPAVIATLSKERTQAVRARDDVLQSYQLDEEVLKERENYENAKEAVDNLQKNRDELEAKKSAVKAQITADTPAETSASLRTELDALSQQIFNLKSQRKPAGGGGGGGNGSDETSEKLRDIHKERTRIIAELEEITKQIPLKEVKFDVALLKELVGPGGATVRQLQQDYGVTINTDKEGVASIRGGDEDVDAAAKAIETLFERAKLNRHSEVITYDPALTRDIIGPQGTVIDRIQSQSGARLHVDSKTGKIDVTGNPTAVNAAKQMIQEVLRNAFRVDFKYVPEMYGAILGRGGANVKALQDEFSGVRNIRVQREPAVISIQGSEDAVKACKAKIEASMEAYKNNTIRLTLEKRMVPVVIGKGGRTIQDIEEKTGANVSVRETTVLLRGPPEATAAAKEMIEELVNKDEVRVEVDQIMFGVLTPELLEEIRALSGSDSVSLYRAERCVTIRGKKDPCRRAKTALEGKLVLLKPMTKSLPFPPVMWSWLRDEKDKLAKDLGLDYINVDRTKSVVDLCSNVSDTLDTAHAKIKEILTAEGAKVKSIPFQEGDARYIIGQGGRNISEIVRRSQAEVYLNRDNSTVQMYGSPAAVAEAMRLVKETLDEAAAIEKSRPPRHVDPASSRGGR